MNRKIQILPLLFLGISQFAFSQIKEEKLILDRKREPEVRKIEKKQTSVQTEKNYPPKEKRIQDSLNLKYEITDVPAVSDFHPSPIEGQDIAPNFRSAYQNNYVRFGMGNYGKVLGDANISTILENKMQVGADVHYLSTTGLKKEYDWDSGSTNAEGTVFLNHYGDAGKATVQAKYSLDDYNYYGIYALKPAADIDLKQRVNQFGVNAAYDYYSNEILDDVRVKTSFLSDHFDAKENFAEVDLNLAKNELLVTTKNGLNLDAGLHFGLATQDAKFDLLNKNSSTNLLIKITPELKMKVGDSYLKLGVNFNYLNQKFADKNNAGEKDGITSWYPMAELMYRATPQFNLYAGVDGGRDLNTYSALLEKNPYLVSDQQLRSTETKYHIYFGVKGDVSENLKYDFFGGYSKVNDAVFYRHDGLFDDINTLNRSAYNFANVLSVVYDSGKKSEVNAAVQWFPIENLSVDGNVKYHKYTLDNLKNVYGEDGVDVGIGAKYSMLNHKLLLGFKALFSTPNTVNIFEINPSATDPSVLVSEQKKKDVAGYADLNLSAEYKINKNFSIFALGNNLLNQKYQPYFCYKVLGAQITGGLKISF